MLACHKQGSTVQCNNTKIAARLYCYKLSVSGVLIYFLYQENFCGLMDLSVMLTGRILDRVVCAQLVNFNSTTEFNCDLISSFCKPMFSMKKRDGETPMEFHNIAKSTHLQSEILHCCNFLPIKHGYFILCGMKASFIIHHSSCIMHQEI